LVFRKGRGEGEVQAGRLELPRCICGPVHRTPFFGSFDAPRSERSWINLCNKEAQNPFTDSFGFKRPVLDFLKRKRTLSLVR